MLASDILCIILLGITALMLLCLLGALIEWVCKHNGYGIMMKITGAIVILVLLGIMVGAIISVAVIM